MFEWRIDRRRVLQLIGLAPAAAAWAEHYDEEVVQCRSVLVEGLNEHGERVTEEVELRGTEPVEINLYDPSVTFDWGVDDA